MNHNQLKNSQNPNVATWKNIEPNGGFDPDAAARHRANAQIIQPPETATANFAERARQKRLRQKDKLACAILYGTDTMTAENPPLLSPEEHQKVYDFFNNGQITDQYESDFLKHLTPPTGQHDEKAAEVLNSLDTKHMRRILANFSHRGFENWQSTDPDDVTNMLKTYPTPVEFDPAADQFLDDIRRGNSELKAKAYADALNDFKHNFYGKRQQYHEAFNNLRADALSQNMKQKSVTGRPLREEYSSPERADAVVLGPVESFGDQGGFIRREIHLKPGETPPEGSLVIPPRDNVLHTSASETPLDDSLHYMSPEVAERFTPNQSSTNPSESQSPAKQPKPGLFGRLFGRQK